MIKEPELTSKQIKRMFEDLELSKEKRDELGKLVRLGEDEGPALSRTKVILDAITTSPLEAGNA